MAELVTVLAILALFAAMAAPRFTSASNNNAMNQATDRLIGLYERASRHARAESASALVTCDLGMDKITATLSSGTVLDIDLGSAPYEVDVVRCDFAGAAGATIDAWGDADVSSSFLLRRGDVELIVKIGSRTSDTTSARKGNVLWDTLAPALSQ